MFLDPRAFRPNEQGHRSGQARGQHRRPHRKRMTVAAINANAPDYEGTRAQFQVSPLFGREPSGRIGRPCVALQGVVQHGHS